MAQLHEHPPCVPKEGEMKGEMATTDRQNPYAGDPNQDPADRSDTAITHREDPYEGDPDRISEDPVPEDRA
jgi:hypothetical protein